MSKTGITEYDLLISCPGDVEEFIDYIEEAVKKFNRYFGRDHNMRLQTKYWPQESYSQVEDIPQSVLRKKFVSECDMAVAVFWTRFGPSTDSYGSGTEEEIQTMIASQKQVFLYFLEKKIFPSEIDPDFMKVREFRERCKQKGLYFEVSDERDLSYNLFEDLMRFFSEAVGRERKELPIKNISETLKVQHAWLADDKRIMIGNFIS